MLSPPVMVMVLQGAHPLIDPRGPCRGLLECTTACACYPSAPSNAPKTYAAAGPWAGAKRPRYTPNRKSSKEKDSTGSLLRTGGGEATAVYRLG